MDFETSASPEAYLATIEENHKRLTHRLELARIELYLLKQEAEAKYDKQNRTVRWCDQQLKAGYSRWSWYRELIADNLIEDQGYYGFWIAGKQTAVRLLLRDIETFESDRAKAVEALRRVKTPCT